MESAVLEPYDKLIPVVINGRTYEVPENNTLLRVLQYMNLELAYTKYCWNGDCRNCAFRYISRRTGKEVEALGCQMRCFANIQITRLPEGIHLPGGQPQAAPAAGNPPPASGSGSSSPDGTPTSGSTPAAA
ncbi:MAG TPA: hypothetical protein VFQ07_04060 [Candidatus Polarisedimenticolia bacterium]|nr:hypothetical protein [Candidatus Polarisedimenticolia bacterium]